MGKRSMDILLAGSLSLLALPVIVIAAVLIRLDSAGPVLFRQRRMGRHFTPFYLLKLRTMRANPGGPAITLGDDPRITRVGRWLRRSKIDELPQLWNVLSGEMSMVGPRPVIPELAAEFRYHYRRLLAVRPGLTDPATLKYCREVELLSQVPDPLRHFMTVVTPDKLRISAAYLHRACLWTDLCVLVQTLLALIAPRWGRGSYLPETPRPVLSAAPLLSEEPAP